MTTDINYLFLIANVTLCIISFLGCAPASASEILSYNASLSSVTVNAIDIFLENQKAQKISEFDIARTDLNGDGFDEYILQPKVCGYKQKICTYMILAEMKGKLIVLAQIHARKLILGGTFSHGIQDFLAFQKDNNDYEYERYIWSPAQVMYILEEAH